MTHHSVHFLVLRISLIKHFPIIFLIGAHAFGFGCQTIGFGVFIIFQINFFMNQLLKIVFDVRELGFHVLEESFAVCVLNILNLSTSFPIDFIGHKELVMMKSSSFGGK